MAKRASQPTRFAPLSRLDLDERPESSREGVHALTF
jgi:hypothetical protein